MGIFGNADVDWELSNDFDKDPESYGGVSRKSFNNWVNKYNRFYHHTRIDKIVVKLSTEKAYLVSVDGVDLWLPKRYTVIMEDGSWLYLWTKFYDRSVKEKLENI